jgi:hypothetical protein
MHLPTFLCLICLTLFLSLIALYTGIRNHHPCRVGRLLDRPQGRIPDPFCSELHLGTEGIQQPADGAAH